MEVIHFAKARNKDLEYMVEIHELCPKHNSSVSWVPFLLDLPFRFYATHSHVRHRKGGLCGGILKVREIALL
ncbi:hypothetical protein HPP92_007219 [Vanilla planifolia]|uniref:Uncharacterized protein n=1 Tax=Vanilla planifolia TaxID=51239 RepID=A0A835V8H3_VANPL|nr:hypothetical protein HPP92_007219 [Vanilla planifolia]